MHSLCRWSQSVHSSGLRAPHGFPSQNKIQDPSYGDFQGPTWDCLCLSLPLFCLCCFSFCAFAGLFAPGLEPLDQTAFFQILHWLVLVVNWVLAIRKLTLDHSGLAALSITCILSYFILFMAFIGHWNTSFIYLLTICFLHISSLGSGALFLLLMTVSSVLPQYLEHSRCSIKSSWLEMFANNLARSQSGDVKTLRDSLESQLETEEESIQ